MRTLGAIHLTLGVIAFVVLGVPAIRTGRMEGIVEVATLVALIVASPLAVLAIAHAVRRARGAKGGVVASTADAADRWARDPGTEAAAHAEGARARARRHVAVDPRDGDDRA